MRDDSGMPYRTPHILQIGDRNLLPGSSVRLADKYNHALAHSIISVSGAMLFINNDIFSTLLLLHNKYPKPLQVVGNME